MDIGAQIKAIRQQSLLSQETFAKELGVSFRSVYKELHADRETGC